MEKYALALLGGCLWMMQSSGLGRFIYQAIRVRRYQPRSGVPFIGSLLLLPGLAMIDLPTGVIFLPLAIESALTAIAWCVVKYINPIAGKERNRLANHPQASGNENINNQ
ncbi:MAG: hypothetical protein KAY06_04895 [Aeromonadaceae bacterium]|nr:hypothetical protein [Aeromonadaceae bacterium]